MYYFCELCNTKYIISGYKILWLVSWIINIYYVIQEDDNANYYTGARNGMFEAEGYEEIDPKEELVSIVTVNKILLLFLPIYM